MRTAVIAGTVLALATVAPLFGRGPDVSTPVEGAAAGSALRPVMTRRYVMSGKVRPLLFWIGKEDIGEARIVWRRGEAGVGYEFLVGTDPAKAPRALNRWGYIAEDGEGAGGSLLALMTGADENSYADAESSSARPAGAGDFRAISARVGRGEATWQTARVTTPSALTVHDVDATLDRVRHETSAVATRSMPLPAGARPGFLTAVAELLDQTVRGVRDHADARTLTRPRLTYVFGQGSYELQLREAETTLIEHGGQSVPAVRTAFEIRTLATNVRTRFELTSGTSGDLAGVPLSISWQPRWWLRVGLTLAE